MVPAAAQSPGSAPVFWRDLNVFIAAFALITFMGSFIVVIPLSLLTKLVLPSRQAEALALPLAYGLMALGLAYWWWKHGLSPQYRDPRREGRFRWGHILLIVFNAGLLVMFALAFGAGSFLPRMQGLAGTGTTVAMLASVTSLAPIVLIAGLFMVWSSRGEAPGFTDTLPAAQAKAAKPASARWPPEKAPVGRAPSVIAVVVGLVASSFVLFTAGVFAAIGFQGNSQRFTGTVLPILVVCSVLYLATALWLLRRRGSAAVWVAWGPVLLLTVGLPVVQLVAMVFTR